MSIKRGKIKLIAKSVLMLMIFLLIYMIWQTVQTPIRFEKEKAKRYKAAIQRLKDIRKAQLAYYTAYGHYSGNFDSLISYIKTGYMPVIRAIGEVPDSLTEKQALKLGLVKRDTLKVSVLDSLFSPAYPVDSLPFVPLTGGARFEIGARILEIGSKVSDLVIKHPVFEVKATNQVILKGLDEQLIINLDDELMQYDKYPGLKVGSLETNVNNAGNWE